MLPVLLLYALFSLVYPLSKIVFENYAQPIFFTGIRMACAGSILLLYIAFRHRERLFIKAIHIKPLLVLTLCNIYLTNVCEAWGLLYLSSVKTCFIYNLCPFFSAIISYFALGETLSAKKILGFLIGFLGFIPLLLEKSDHESLLGGFSCFSWAELSLVTAALATVIGWIYMRKLVQMNFCPIAANGISMFVSSFLILPTSFYAGELWSPIPVTNMLAVLPYLIALMLISNILAYNIYGTLLNRYTATFLTFAGLTSPLFAALSGWLIHGESISFSILVSVACVTIGLLISYADELALSRNKVTVA